MFNSVYLLLLCQATLCFLSVFGEPRQSNPLQQALSTLQCYESKHDCENPRNFLDEPEFSNYTKAANQTGDARTRFYLFTNRNQDNPEMMHECGGSPSNTTNFNASCHVLIIFPGFVSGFCHMAVYREMIYERFKCGCWNIIGADWTWGSSFDLVTAKYNQEVVAGQISVIVRKLKARFGLTHKNFTCMGHSLGAHGCGIVGQLEPIYAIHGIDPAGVLYWEGMDLDERLDPCDAELVQVTHCNAGQCLVDPLTKPLRPLPDWRTYFAINYTCGTRDVWYNDGRNQPSCIKQMLISFAKGDILYGLISLYPAACSHLQCLYYYKTSMNPNLEVCDSVAEPCENPLNNGYGTENPVTVNPVTVEPVTVDPVSVEPVSVDPVLRSLIDETSGQKYETYTIVGANFCDSDRSQHKNLYLKTPKHCPFCDEQKYQETKGKFNQSCSNKDETEGKPDYFNCPKKTDT